MNLIVIHESKNYSLVNQRAGIADEQTKSQAGSLLRFSATVEPLAGVVFSSLNGNSTPLGNNNTFIAVPQDWPVVRTKTMPNIIRYRQTLPILSKVKGLLKPRQQLVLSNGRFLTRVRWRQLAKGLAGLNADLTMVTVDPALLSYREKVRLSSNGNVAGFSRLYFDSAIPAAVPADWPHHIFVKAAVLERVLLDGALPPAFPDFLRRCNSNSMNVLSLKIGGTVLDLETEAGLLNFLTANLKSIRYHRRSTDGSTYNNSAQTDNSKISPEARLIGKVIIGQRVCISENAVVLGPTILCDNVKLRQGAMVRASVIGPGVTIPENEVIQNRIIVQQVSQDDLSLHSKTGQLQPKYPELPFVLNGVPKNNFRTWPIFSYARCIKRATDIIASLAVLILFAPILPVIALAIKVSSPGPVFFRDRRQGLHGKEFYCLKFRTMVPGADKIQEKLRVVNQTDGPQFKIDDDPRVSAVGRFLRETYIDEISQFLNVLLGQMSVVGPRPSPQAENLLCPAWRDARLSARPGITGLWQICRTRHQGRDFQEWIHYDTEYIRNLSFRLDLWISWRTVKKLFINFIDQF